MKGAAALRKIDARWWLAERGQVWRAVSAKMARIRERQQPRREMYKFFAELYSGQELDGLGLTAYDVAQGGPSVYVPPSQPFNVTRRAVETVVARIGKERPLPRVTTDEGDYSLYRRAKRMTKAIEGGFEKCEVFRHTTKVLRSACVFGSGVVKVWRDDDEPRLDVVFPWELSVDIAEAQYGDPRCIYLEKWFDRGVLLELAQAWGCGQETLDAIAEMRSDGWDTQHGIRLDAEDAYDRVLVTEAWHLPSSKRAKDGRHVITLASSTNKSTGADVLDEPWTKPTFPFAIIHYKDPLVGFWGDSIAQELSGYQIEINLVGSRLRAAHNLVGTGIWLTSDQSGLLEQDFTNDIAPILRHRPGHKPEHMNPDPAAPQTYQWLYDLRRMAPEDVGLNEMAMSGKKPAGIVAAQAIQSIRDETSELMSMPAKAWDQLHVDIGNLLVDMFAEIAEEHGDVTLRSPTRRGFKQYSWKDTALPRDAYNLATQATSMLAKTPAGRLQQVYDLFNAKVISRTLFLRLLDSPDIQAETDLDAAPQVIVDEQIEAMLDAEDPTAPEAFQQPMPFMDLTYAMHRTQCQWALAKMQGAPPETLDLLLDYLAACRALLESAAGVPSGAGAPDAAAPPVPPAPGPLPAPPADAMTPGGTAPPAPPGVPLQ